MNNYGKGNLHYLDKCARLGRIHSPAFIIQGKFVTDIAHENLFILTRYEFTKILIYIGYVKPIVIVFVCMNLTIHIIPYFGYVLMRCYSTMISFSGSTGDKKYKVKPFSEM